MSTVHEQHCCSGDLVGENARMGDDTCSTQGYSTRYVQYSAVLISYSARNTRG